MIERILQARALTAARHFPVVTITGPRQSGKTTFAQMVFPRMAYANLELPDLRQLALRDPRGFLASYPDGAVIDEVQRAPELLSYLQDRVDRHQRPGEFVVTGSQHLGLLQAVTQSLAGRTAVLNLYPLTRRETERFPAPPQDALTAVLFGGYPAIYDRGIPPAEWFASYVTTYVERDVRQVLGVGDLVAFQSFLELCAGRVGQLLNLSGLAADLGITHNTVKAWLSVLETGFVTFRLPPLSRSLRKRLARRPKLYFCDTGLACYLLGITTTEQLRRHPLRGPLFECWVVSEILKERAHRGVTRGLSFYRTHRGEEVDLIIEADGGLRALEVKSSQTIPPEPFAATAAFARVVECADAKRGAVTRGAAARGDATRGDAARGDATRGDATRGAASPVPVQQLLAYAGDTSHTRSRGAVLSWRELHRAA